MVCLTPLFHKRNATTWRLWQRGTFSFSTVWLGISSDSSNSAAHSLLVMVCWITLFHKRNSTTWRLWHRGTFSFSTVWLGVCWDSSNSAWHSLLDLDEKNISRMFKNLPASTSARCHFVKVARCYFVKVARCHFVKVAQCDFVRVGGWWW